MNDEAERTSPASGGEPPAGGRLGRYVVLGRLGVGATGEVLAAYDPELDRKVALRLLRPRDGDRRDEPRRLAAVQALARLSDPHVVAVHDVGLHEDRVFVAMELVEGRTLGAWLGAGRRSWVRVLDVMLQAGRGLAAAHAQGLVHGDFGPDDVTIAEDGRVRVMDLGLARAIDASSGEEGQRDGVAADVRAFAACLDAALRSTGPHGRAAGPRWLRRVVARGFGSMPALLDELARGEARARRRRWLAALVLATGVGAGAFGWQRHTRAVSVRECEAEAASLAETWDDSVAAAVQDALVATGVPRAAGTAERVRPWLDAQAQAWQQARTQACLHARVDGTWSDETLERARWCLDERRMELEALVSELQSGDARIVDRAVPAAWSLRSPAPCLDADALARLPAPPVEEREAVRALLVELSHATVLQQAGALERGLATAEAALAQARAQGWRPVTAAVMRRVAILHDARGEPTQAEAMLEDAYFEALGAEAHDVAADAASSLVYVVGVTLGRPAEGLEWARHHELLLAHPVPDPAGWRRTNALANVASIHRAAGDHAQAEALLREVLAIRERELGPEHPVLGLTLNNLANVLQATGELAAAKVLLERALAIQEPALGGDDPMVALTLNNLGNIEHALGSPARAQALLERALAIEEQVLGREHLHVAATLSNLGNILQENGELARARALQERALAIRLAVLGEDHVFVASSLLNLGSVLAALGELDAARARYEQALAIQTRAPGQPEVGLVLASLAEVALAQGSTAEAVTLAERALRLHEAGEASPGTEGAARAVLEQAATDPEAAP